MTSEISCINIKHNNACCIRFELLSDALISDRHTTSGIHKNIIQRSNQVWPRTNDNSSVEQKHTDKKHPRLRQYLYHG